MLAAERPPVPTLARRLLSTAATTACEQEGSMTQQEPVRRARNATRQAAARAARQPWVRPLARLGYVAIGAVYALIGVLALRLAFGLGGEATDQRGALREILEAPFGRILLGLVALGLAGYLLWRIIEAVLDVEDKGGDAKGLLVRAGYVISGLLAGGLGLSAARLALGGGDSGDSGDNARSWTARLLEQPFGVWLVILLGAVVIGVGLFQLYQAWKGTYRDKLAWDRMSADERSAADRVARVGLVAHGVVLGITGWFFVRAALNVNPEEAGSIGDALTELAAQPYGPWLLGAVAAGLIAFGAFRFFEGRYHHILAR